jgi:hypothetical protein
MKTNTVSTETYQRRLNQLINEVSNHTNRSELLNIMEEQLVEDSQNLGDLYTDGQYTHLDSKRQKL